MQEQGSGGGSSMLRTRPNTIIRGEVQGEYVVRGAKIKCSKALKEEAYDVVNLPLCHGVYSGKEPLINIKDMKDGENIVNGFGICSETGTPCVDEMKFHINWINRKKIRLHIEGEEAVTTNSFTMCSAHGGEITFENSGQTAVYHPKNEKAKDELLTTKETSPYKTNNIQNTISDGFANVFSGLGTIKACESAIKYLGQVWKEAEGHPKVQEEIHNLANKIRKQILFIGELTSVDEEYLDSIRRQIESGDGADPLAKNNKEMSIANYEKIPEDNIEPIVTEELETEYNKLMKKLNEASIIFTKMQSEEEVENSQIEMNDNKNHISPYLQNREFWVERCDDWIFPVVGMLDEDSLIDDNYFGAKRGNRTHAGIDLNAPVGTEIIAMTDGVVDGIYNFFGVSDAIAVINTDGTIARYAELQPISGLKVGDNIKKGEVIGKLIYSKDRYCMLHLEVYDGTRKGALKDKSNRETNKHYLNVRPMNYERRSDLIDPTGVLYLKDAEKYNKYSVEIKEIGAICVSNDGLNFIANHEVNINTLVLDSNNKIISIKTSIENTTIGYGYDLTRNPLKLDIKEAQSISPDEALKLLKTVANKMASKIVDSPLITRPLKQHELDALVTLRYNIGSLGVVNNLIMHINENAPFSLLKEDINNYYDEIIKKNKKLERYRIGWRNRTDETLELYYYGNYGTMPLDVISGCYKE